LSAPVFELDTFDLIACEGVDAKSFLQSLLSNDVELLAGVGSWQWTALLSPQGRVQALMQLIRSDADAYLLAVPHRRGAAIIDQLRRFVLRRKISLRIDSERYLLGSNAGAPAPAGTLPLQPEFADGRQCFLAAASGDHLPADSNWTRQDFIGRIPWLPAAAADRHLAQALGLDVLGAISMKKGCYPGQEIVARTHYLGRSKRHLVLLESDGNQPEVVAGSQVRDGENQLAGELIDVLACEAGILLLAVVSDERLGVDLAAVLTDSRRIPLRLVKVA